MADGAWFAALTGNPAVSKTTTVIAGKRGKPRPISHREGMSNKKAINAAVINRPGNGANCTSTRLSTNTFNPITGSTKPIRNQAGHAFT